MRWTFTMNSPRCQTQSAERRKRETEVFFRVPLIQRSNPRHRCAKCPRSLFVRELTLHHDRRLDAEHALHLLLDLGHEHGIVLQEELRVLSALANPLAAVAVPCARLVDNARFSADVHKQ